MELFSEDEITPVSAGHLKAADYDNDGDIDLAITGRRGSWDYVTQIFENQDGTYTDINAGLYGVRNSKLDWADYDDDGDLDLIVTGHVEYEDPSVCKVYRNDGSNTFTDLNLDIHGVRQGDVDWIDFNQDGKPDIVMNGIATNEGLWIGYFYLNAGADQFVQMPVPDTLTSLKYAVMEFGDFDGDLDADLFLNGRYDYMDYRNMLVENTFNAENTPPTAPLNLEFTVNGENSITFTWDAASDNESESLSYNLKIGTESGGNDIISAHTNADGKYQIAKRGNMDLRYSYTMLMQEGITYYASVQAVDNSYINSDFSEELSFSFVSVEDIASGISVYPNPADEYIIINADDLPGAIITLIDMQGKTVLQEKLNSESQKTINVKAFKSGTYIMSVRSGNNIVFKKIAIN
jgi:hypothetical protein